MSPMTLTKVGVILMRAVMPPPSMAPMAMTFPMPMAAAVDGDVAPSRSSPGCSGSIMGKSMGER
jgi:hypothetical protein